MFIHKQKNFQIKTSLSLFTCVKYSELFASEVAKGANTAVLKHWLRFSSPSGSTTVEISSPDVYVFHEEATPIGNTDSVEMWKLLSLIMRLFSRYWFVASVKLENLYPCHGPTIDQLPSTHRYHMHVSFTMADKKDSLFSLLPT